MNYTAVATFAIVAVLIASMVICLLRSRRFTAAIESVTLGVEFKVRVALYADRLKPHLSSVFLRAQIYFATLQILCAYAMLLEEILINPLKAFLQTLSFAIDVPEVVGGLGLSCANPELSSFKTILIMATLTPVVLSLGIAVSFAIRIVVFKYDRTRTLRSHGLAFLLLLYLTLPSTSITIFKAFLCDSRPLGENGEGYLVVDYAGALLVLVLRRSIVLHVMVPCLLRNSELRGHRVQQLYLALRCCSFAHLPRGRQPALRDHSFPPSRGNPVREDRDRTGSGSFKEGQGHIGFGGLVSLQAVLA